MSKLPRTVGDVLAEHVTLEVECIDRLYLNVYVPGLQFPEGVVRFFKGHRGALMASSALMDPMTKAFVAAVHRFAKTEVVPWVDFVKGQRKDDIAHEHLAAFEAAGGTEGVLFVGRAQEKTALFRTEKRRNPVTGKTYPWIVRSTGVVNHFYVYAVDADFGPFFIKFCSYFPYTAKLCVNGNEWAKRQVSNEGLTFEALDNGFLSCEDPRRLQEICSSFGPDDIRGLLDRWLTRIPSPFTDTDRDAGYTYDVSVLQAEFSLTQVLDRPLSGRVFFEEVIRDNLDLGRPDQVSLIFDRRVFHHGPHQTPSRFRTRVLTQGVIPSIHVDYKHSRIKQYFKEGRALRTETTINDSRDFDIGKRLINLPALGQVGFSANRRLLDIEHATHDTFRADEAFTAINQPAIIGDQRAAGLRFGDPRTQALLHCLVLFRFQPDGFTNRDLRTHLAPLLGRPPDTVTPGQVTYDLRRLRLHGLIRRLPHTHRYELTDLGRATAPFLTRLHDRAIRRGLGALTEPANIRGHHLRAAANTYDNAITRLLNDAGLAA